MPKKKESESTTGTEMNSKGDVGKRPRRAHRREVF